LKSKTPKPKRVSGLHFVLGEVIYLFGGGHKPPKPMPGYVPVGRFLSIQEQHVLIEVIIERPITR